MIDFAKVLNAEQCAAATAGDGPILVLAAAGTGKTRTLVHRVAYLVEKGVPPSNILLLTFTNRAAREMLDRAEQLVPDLEGMWSGTFHSVCARLLRRYAYAIGFKPDFQILDEDDQKKLMGQCIKSVVKNSKDFVKKELLLSKISDAVNRQKDLRLVLSAAQTETPINLEEALKVCDEYEKRKRELGAMDFDDLLVRTLEMLQQHEDIRSALQEHFKYILVDEYQDTNIIQSQFTDLLAAKHKNLMVVGDDFQCIYTWRGAQFENIMQFPTRWSGCKVLKLERNYRSVAPVLDVANVVMRDVQHQFEKTLRPARQVVAPKPRLYHVFDGKAQAQAVQALVEQLYASGVPYNDIAILYRSHYTSIDLQLAFTRSRLPFQITSGIGVFEQLHVKDVLAFLRVCTDPTPTAELSFMRLMELLPGVGETTARKYWKNLGGAFNSASPLERMNLGSMLGPKAAPLWPALEEAFSSAADCIAAGEDRLVMQSFIDGFYAPHLHKMFDEADMQSRLEDLQELTAQIASYENGLKGFLSEVALLTNLDMAARNNLPSDHMHLTTVHQAKGMEWPVVIVPWATEGIFPASRSVEEGNIDEERRLFYVAVTRARDRLYLFAPRMRKLADGGMYPCEDSIFVQEIPRNLLEERSIYSEPPPQFRQQQTRYGGAYNRYSRW